MFVLNLKVILEAVTLIHINRLDRIIGTPELHLQHEAHCCHHVAERETADVS